MLATIWFHIDVIESITHFTFVISLKGIIGA